MKKKVWEKPRLIVLFRGRQEERVLDTCKGTLPGGPNGSPLCASFSGDTCQSTVGS